MSLFFEKVENPFKIIKCELLYWNQLQANKQKKVTYFYFCIVYGTYFKQLELFLKKK